MRILAIIGLSLAALTSAAPALGAKKIPLEFAFRNPIQTERVVTLQGDRAGESKLVEACTQSLCACSFFQSHNDMGPLVVAAEISPENKAAYCELPLSVPPGSYPFVQLKTADGKQKTVRIEIRNRLTLEKILGRALSKTKVRGIFRYSCSRTFFEGEGVSTSQISCVPGQRLGVINASYNFYTFRSSEDSNHPGGDEAFRDSICGRNSFLKTQCTGNTPELRYGFYKESAGPFMVGISMTRAPEGENLSGHYGFAALLDRQGRCPVGLVKARPWAAQPSSIIEGSLGDNPPSSFINTGNSLNNTVVEIQQPANFLVNRQPNLTPCSGTDGNCVDATFGGMSTVQSVSYMALTPVVCVLPPDLLTGIF